MERPQSLIDSVQFGRQLVKLQCLFKTVLRQNKEPPNKTLINYLDLFSSRLEFGCKALLEA